MIGGYIMQDKMQAKNITIKDIAKATGTSYTTVSRALNGKAGVSKKTREYVLIEAKKMGYSQNAIARNLVMKKTNTIGLIVPDITNPFFAEISFAVEHYAIERGYSVILSNTIWNSKIEKKRLDLMLSNRVDGIIIKNADDTINFDYTSLGRPVILLSSGMENVVSSVDYDDIEGGFLATEHLIRCGYKRIAFIGGEKLSCAFKFRHAGYEKALKQYGFDINPDYVKHGNFTIDCGDRLASELFKMEKRPDATVCLNDMVAFGAVQAALRHGIKIPDEFGVIGYDDIYFSGLSQIQLTTISQSSLSMGKMAAEILINEIESSEYNPTKILLTPTLKVRNTTRKIN